jgi:hypothetical protein
MTGSCDHGDEPLYSIKGGEFLDSLNDYQLSETDSAPCSEVPMTCSLMFI